MFSVERGRTGRQESRESSAALSIDALGFLAERPELLSRFLQVSGLEAHQLRAASHDESFFVNLLDFILADEQTLLSFADHAQIPPARIAEARRVLGGAAADSGV